MGKGSGTNTVTTNSQPPQWLQNNLQSVYGQAQNVTSQPLQQYGGSVVAGFTPQQQQAFNTVNNSQGIATPYINSAAQLLGNSSSLDPNSIAQYQSPYTQQVVNATQNQLNQNDAVQQQQLLGSTIASGASPFGGDRAGVASAALAGQQDLSNNQTISNLYNQGYTTALGAAEQNDYLGQQGAAGMANLGTTAQNSALTGANAELQSGALQQQLNQEQLNIPYEQFIQQQAYPYQQLSALETATGLAGGLAGGTGSTTSPSPSTASQLGGLGLTGLGIYGASQSNNGGAKDGGAISGFNKGGIAKFASGGGGLPSIPDVSVSYLSNPNTSLINGVGASGQYQPPQIAHSDIPKAPNAYNSTTQQSQGMGTGIPGMNTGAMGAIGQGAKALYNQAFPASTTGSALTPDFAGAYNAAGDGSGYVAAGASNPIMSGITAGNVGTDAIGTNTGAGLASQFGITGASVEGGGDALASSGMLDALGSAGAEDLGADALGSMALLALRKGGVAKYAFGGGSAPVSTSTSATGIAVPQINNDALYNSPSVTVGGDLGGLPQYKNTVAPIVTPSLLASPASSSASSSATPSVLNSSNPYSNPALTGSQDTTSTANSQILGQLAQIYPTLTNAQLNQMVNANPEAAAAGAYQSPSWNSYVQQQGWKKGGIAKFADGGDDTNYSSMDQAAAPVDYDPANAVAGQGMDIGRNYDANGSYDPASSFMGQGMARQANDATAAGYNAIPVQANTPQQQLLSVLDPGNDGADPLEQQTSAQAAITGSHPGFEAQKDPDVKVNTSGNEVTIDHPNGEVVKTGLPVAPKQSNFDKWSPLIAAGLGMMAGTSPFAAVNIGRGALEGLKQYSENEKQTLAQQKEDAEQQYQKGQLTNQSTQQVETNRHNLADEQNAAAKVKLLQQQIDQGKIGTDLYGNKYYTTGPHAGQNIEQDNAPLGADGKPIRPPGMPDFQGVQTIGDNIGIPVNFLNPKTPRSPDATQAYKMQADAGNNVSQLSNAESSFQTIKNLIPKIDQGMMATAARAAEKAYGQPNATPDSANAAALATLPLGSNERAAYEELSKLESNAALQNEVSSGIGSKGLGFNMVRLGQTMYAGPEMSKQAQMNIVNKSLMATQVTKGANEIISQLGGATTDTLSRAKQKYINDSYNKGYAIPSNDYVHGYWKKSGYAPPSTQGQYNANGNTQSAPSNVIRYDTSGNRIP